MPLQIERVVEIAREAIKEAFDTVQARVDQVASFLDESDWALVIKLHTMVEAAVTQLLVAHTDSALHQVMKHIPLSDVNTGKARMAKDLGLISSSQLGFIQRFSTLRNKLAHNADNLEFDLKEHVRKMDSNQRRQWKRDLNWAPPGGIVGEDRDSAIEEPKTELYLSIIRLMSLMAVDETFKKLNNKAIEESMKLESDLFRKENSAE